MLPRRLNLGHCDVPSHNFRLMGDFTSFLIGAIYMKDIRAHFDYPSSREPPLTWAQCHYTCVAVHSPHIANPLSKYATRATGDTGIAVFYT